MNGGTIITNLKCCRLCGLHVIQDEEPAWFPAEELREYHTVVPHKVSLLRALKENETETRIPLDASLIVTE